MENKSLNYEQIHLLLKGHQVDLDNHAESNESYSHSINLRLYSENGVLSLETLQGTKPVNHNSETVKYLGSWAFSDELIVFVKTELPIPEDDYTTVEELFIDVNDSDSFSETDSISSFDFDSNINATILELPVINPVDNPDDFEQNISCVESQGVEEGDVLGLYIRKVYDLTKVCPLNNEEIPINNTEYRDAIYSMSYNSEGDLVSKLLWIGHLNFPIDSKIVTQGIYENQFYKRVYFTDFLNESRVVNIADKYLKKRQPQEFSLSTSGLLLNPRLKSINDNGSLPAMSVIYSYRLISENGQTSDYSPFSDSVKILKEYSGPEISGLGTKEPSGKSVTVFVTSPDHKSFKWIELIAIEFEANLVPTALRLIERKQVAYYNEFTHFGTEPEFSSNITLADIFENSISWKYNSDFKSKDNILLASGLRNEPNFFDEKNTQIDFGLMSFDIRGNTHDCILNPNPDLYHYIDKDMDSAPKYVKRKLFNDIFVFNSSYVYLENVLTGEKFSKLLVSNGFNYVNRTQDVLDFLLLIQSDEPDFPNFFPNLLIEQVQEGFVFKPIDENIKTDFKNYSLNFSSSQVSITLQNDLQVKSTPDWTTLTNSQKNARLVYGSVSNGWFNGNGIRLTFKTITEEVVEKHNDWIPDDSGGFPVKLINNETQDFEKPFKKVFMKGEIYRLGIEWYKNGNRLFTTPIGDIKVPEIGWKSRELTINYSVHQGEIIQNWKDEGDKLHSMGLQLMADVRISCEYSKYVDAYRIVYVERTEENRTIISQGITFPLERNIANFDHDIDERINGKWCLPYNGGGPVYDAQGLLNFDNDPNNNTYTGILSKITTHRSLFSFDSPDIVNYKLSAKRFQGAYVQYLETVETDDHKNQLLNGYSSDTSVQWGPRQYGEWGSEVKTYGTPTVISYLTSRYSSKIPRKLISEKEEDSPPFMISTIFSRRIHSTNTVVFPDNYIQNKFSYFPIEKHYDSNEGEVASSYRLDEAFDVSNNSIGLHHQALAYTEAARGPDSSLTYVNNIAVGRNTVFIKSGTGVSGTSLGEHFYNGPRIGYSQTLIKNAPNDYNFMYHTYNYFYAKTSYIIANVRALNSDSVYGGRSDFAYYSNEFLALSDVIPVIKDAQVSQIFTIEGDSYCSLYLRNKSNFNSGVVPKKWDFSGLDVYNSYSGWCYGVFLESTINPYFNNSNEFYKKEKDFGFKYEEEYNKAYFQENDLRKAIPEPFGFKDDFSLGHIIAASKVKLRGDYFDAWTVFKTNEFYELDKDQGTAYNLAKQNDQVYAIQENQTSALLINERALASTQSGSVVNIPQGDGSTISGHQVVSKYGTSFRRAVIESHFGFVFYDERNNEFVKIAEPLFISNNLALEYQRIFKDDPIVDAEGYFDYKYKESCIRVRTLQGNNFVISYNEVLKVFNGRYTYDNDLYMPFQNKVIAPLVPVTNTGVVLHELNSGDELVFFDVPKGFEVGITSSPEYASTKIIKGIAVITNINYNFNEITYNTSLGDSRTILSTHHWYKIREGAHTIPSKNMMDTTDIRGNWVDIKIKGESVGNKKVKIFSIINYVRNSYK